MSEATSPGGTKIRTWATSTVALAAVVDARTKAMAAIDERQIGTPAMAGLLMTYAKAHWHGVSTPADFRAAAQAASGTDLTSFWRSHGMG